MAAVTHQAPTSQLDHKFRTLSLIKLRGNIHDRLYRKRMVPLSALSFNITCINYSFLFRMPPLFLPTLEHNTRIYKAISSGMTAYLICRCLLRIFGLIYNFHT